MKRFVASLIGVVFAALSVGTAFAQSGALPDDKPKVMPSLIAERAAVEPGGTVTVALNEAIRKNWHTYFVNPGDSGAPTMVSWHLPPGWSAGPLQWPYPKHFAAGPLMTFGYEDQVALLSDIKAPAGAKPGDSASLAADVMWLVCSDEICVPEEAHLSVPLGIAAAPPPPDGRSAPFFAAARAKLPHASPWPAVYDAGDKRFALLIESPELASARPRDVAFYPYADGFLEAAKPQRVGAAAKGLVLEGSTGWKLATKDKRAKLGALSGLLVLTGADGRVDALTVEARPGTVPAGSVTLAGGGGIGVGEALLFAFLGGLILNLMPCVFPVLSMKALALAAKRDAPAAARTSAAAYGAGVLLSFLALAAVLLALRAGGASLGWGFQLQQPYFVTALALLMFAVGLNLSGVFEVAGARLSNLGGSFAARDGATGSFFTGVLAVVVATPCTAPFMGAAMGYALTANAGVALAIFAALGLGFAAPFVLLGFSPRALRVLPRPGAWMGVLRQILAFPLYGAAVWLVWVLSLQAGSDGVLAALAAALVLAFGLWAFGKSQAASGSRRMAALATGAVAILGAVLLVSQAGSGAPPALTAAPAPNSGALAYEPFSAARLADLRQAGRPVFVNATAAWCITCLVNEKVALSSDSVAHAFAERKVAALKADWTNQDSEISALLASQGRSGVPLYLYYAPGAEAPVVLPQLLTQATVMAALDAPR